MLPSSSRLPVPSAWEGIAASCQPGRNGERQTDPSQRHWMERRDGASYILAAWPRSMMATAWSRCAAPAKGNAPVAVMGKLPPCWVFGCFAVPDSFRAFEWWSHNTNAPVHREEGFSPFFFPALYTRGLSDWGTERLMSTGGLIHVHSLSSWATTVYIHTYIYI